MSHAARVEWQRGEQPFLDGRYSREHRWQFDGGTEVIASASPHVVPLPMSNEAAVDPEEAFIAALASCHMLWFLDLCARRGFRVDRYQDAAEGVMGRGPHGRLAMTRVTLRPRTRFSGEPLPCREDVEALHHEAHVACYIANSVNTEVRCEPRW